MDPSVEEVHETLRHLEVCEHYDCFVGVVMAHGNSKGEFQVADGKIAFNEDVLSRFRTSRCRKLAGKPKIFLVNTCRGGGDTDVITIEADYDEVDLMGNMSLKVADDSDFFVAYSTLPGRVSWRDRSQGSWMISTLCNVWEDKSTKGDCKGDLKKMLTRVNLEIARRNLTTNTQVVQRIDHTVKDIILKLD